MTPEEIEARDARLLAAEERYLRSLHPKSRRQRIAEWFVIRKVWFFALAGVLGLVLVLWGLPILLTPDVGDPIERARLAVEERRTVITTLAALGAGVTVWLSWRRHGLEAARHDLERDANRTGRYASAVEQLGSESPHIRLGGIYALERIANDSTRDADVIVDVLAAFVRDTCVQPSEAKEVKAAMEGSWSAPASRIDVHAALTVLGRRTNKEKSVDLTGAYLVQADLRHADLNGARLVGADLTAAKLHGAQLRGAHMSRTKLRRAILTRAQLDRADLAHADLAGANLQSASMAGASCPQADFTAARVDRADFSGAYLRGANLTEVDLTLAADTSYMKRD